uniref:MARVEL domain-containing protein n=1 Tax=Kryptolebias marmoratus TaxID=37003 RepID=A0A3Q3BNT1_KRYMA
MPVIVLEARDFTSPLFIVRTLEILSSCTVFSLVASLESKDTSSSSFGIFRIFCMFTWCFFFVLTLLIHLLNTIQFHSLIPVSWKNLTVTVAVLGALMCFSSSVIFPWMVMDHQKVSARAVAAAVISGFTALVYASEFFVLRGQADEQRGYMGSTPGLLKTLQLWGGVQMIPLVVIVFDLNVGVQPWQILVSCTSYGVCVLMSLVTLVVILGDFAGRCLLPFDRFLASFSLIGVLLYMMATVICLTKILQLNGQKTNQGNHTELVIMETVVSRLFWFLTVEIEKAVQLRSEASL